MAKKENEQAIPIPLENPTIKKVVKCPGCGAKVEVEFEIELDTLIPATLAGALAASGKPVEEEMDDKG